MRAGIHPEYNDLVITIGKDEFVTKSTLKTKKILMDIDYRQHPAWNKSVVSNVNESNKNVADFKKKFGGISFLSPKA